MELNDYQRSALGTARTLDDRDRLLNAALGLAGEAGEVADLVKKMTYHGHFVMSDDIVNELGDLLWYIALAADSLGWSLERVAAKNIQKLAARYPAGFSEQASRERAG